MGGITSKINIKTVNNEGIVYDTDSDGEITNNLLPSEMIEKEYLRKHNVIEKLSLSEKKIKRLKRYEKTIERLKHYKRNETETGIAN